VEELEADDGDVVGVVGEAVVGVVVVVDVVVVLVAGFVHPEELTTVPGEVELAVVVVETDPVAAEVPELLPLTVAVVVDAGAVTLNKALHFSLMLTLHSSQTRVPKYHQAVPRLKSGLSLGHIMQLCMSFVAYGVAALHCW
jgi:hypothetical protein